MVCFQAKHRLKEETTSKKIGKKTEKSSRFFKFKGPPFKQTSLTTTQVNPKIAVSYRLKLFSDLQFYGRCKKNSAKFLFHSSQTDQICHLIIINFILL